MVPQKVLFSVRSASLPAEVPSARRQVGGDISQLDPGFYFNGQIFAARHWYSIFESCIIFPTSIALSLFPNRFG